MGMQACWTRENSRHLVRSSSSADRLGPSVDTAPNSDDSEIRAPPVRTYKSARIDEAVKGQHGMLPNKGTLLVVLLI